MAQISAIINSFCCVCFALLDILQQVRQNTDSPTQLSQRLQCDARGGLKILQVKQYLSFTVCPWIMISFVRGGGRYPVVLEPLATSVRRREVVLLVLLENIQILLEDMRREEDKNSGCSQESYQSDNKKTDEYTPGNGSILLKMQEFHWYIYKVCYGLVFYLRCSPKAHGVSDIFCTLFWPEASDSQKAASQRALCMNVHWFQMEFMFEPTVCVRQI